MIRKNKYEKTNKLYKYKPKKLSEQQFEQQLMEAIKQGTEKQNKKDKKDRRK